MGYIEPSTHRGARRAMRIQVVSDLHLEFHNLLPPVAEGADVLVCAGDLAPIGAGAVRYAAEEWAEAKHIRPVPALLRDPRKSVYGILRPIPAVIPRPPRRATSRSRSPVPATGPESRTVHVPCGGRAPESVSPEIREGTEQGQRGASPEVRVLDR